MPPLSRPTVVGILVALGMIGAHPCSAQTRVTSLEELRRQLETGDLVTVVAGDGQPLTGRLMRVGEDDLDIRPVDSRRTPPDRGPRDVTVRFGAIRMLERPRDSVRNGVAIGAGVAAGAGAVIFLSALAVDRNEVDEWAGPYVAAATVFTGIGALIGWAVDAAKSKPAITFRAPSGGQVTVNVRPVYTRRAGLALAVSFSR
jgi:hypothetical protein